MKLALGLLLLSISVPAFSAAVSYSIVFTGSATDPLGAAVPLPTGSFTYDPAAGFSNFILYWQGAAIDLTPMANSPSIATSPATGCASADHTPAYGFLMVSQTAACDTTPQYGWMGQLFPSGYIFGLMLDTSPVDSNGDPLGPAEDSMVSMGFATTGAAAAGSGNWSIQETPEPATFGLGAAVLMAIAIRQRISRHAA
jgi:hypothetical protein